MSELHGWAADQSQTKAPSVEYIRNFLSASQAKRCITFSHKLYDTKLHGFVETHSDLLQNITLNPHFPQCVPFSLSESPCSLCQHYSLPAAYFGAGPRGRLVKGCAHHGRIDDAIARAVQTPFNRLRVHQREQGLRLGRAQDGRLDAQASSERRQASIFVQSLLKTGSGLPSSLNVL